MIYKVSFSIIKIVIILTLFCHISANLYSQDRLPYPDITESDLSSEEAESSLRVKDEEVITHGNANVDTANNIITLTDDPYIITSTHFVKATKIVWFRDSGRVELSGKARIRSFETNDVAAGNKAIYYQFPTDKKAMIIGIPDSEDDKAFVYSLPNIVQADTISIINDNTFEADGNVEFHSLTNENKASADYGLFKKATNVLILKGNSYILYNDITSKARDITMFMDENKGVMDGNAIVISKSRNAKADKIEIFDYEDSKKTILTGNAILEQYAKTDTDRKGVPVRKAKANEIIYEDLPEEQKLQMEGNGLVIINSNPESPMRGEPYRTIQAENINYKETSDGTEIVLDQNAIFEQLNYEVISAEGSTTKIRTYKELITKANNINITFGPKGEDELILLTGDTRILSPTRSLFSDNGRIEERKYALMTGNVEIYEHDENLTEMQTKAFGDRLQAFNIDDIENSRYLLTGNVRVYKDGNEASGHIMEVINKDNVYIIDGNGFYTDGETEVYADYIEAEDNKFYTLIGEAEVYRGEDYTSGNKMTINQEKNTAIIEGNGYYTDGEREVFADYIETEQLESGNTDFLLSGNVYLTEPNREVVADFVKSKEINSNTTRITLESFYIDERVVYTETNRIIKSKTIIIFQNKSDNQEEADTIAAYLSGEAEITDLNEDVNIKGDVVDYVEVTPYYTVASVNGNGKITQTDGSISADIISYVEDKPTEKEKIDGGKQTKLTIIGTGNVVVETEDNTVYSDYGEFNRIVLDEENDFNNDEIIFKSNVIIDGEDLYAECENMVIMRNPAGSTNLINERWLLLSEVLVKQIDRNTVVTAGIVEYIKEYIDNKETKKQETYEFYDDVLFYEFYDGIEELEKDNDSSNSESRYSEGGRTKENSNTENNPKINVDDPNENSEDVEENKELEEEIRTSRQNNNDSLDGNEDNTNDNDGEQINDNDGEQINDNDGEQINDNDGEQINDNDGEQINDNDGEQINDNDGKQINDNDGEQINDNDGEQINDNDSDQTNNFQDDEKTNGDSSENEEKVISVSQDDIEETIVQLLGLLEDDSDIKKIEPISDDERNYMYHPDGKLLKTRVTGEIVYYNVKNEIIDEQKVEVQTMRTEKNASYNDERLSAEGESIKVIVKTHPDDAEIKEDYEFFINEGYRDKEIGETVDTEELKDETNIDKNDIVEDEEEEGETRIDIISDNFIEWLTNVLDDNENKEQATGESTESDAENEDNDGSRVEDSGSNSDDSGDDEDNDGSRVEDSGSNSDDSGDDEDNDGSRVEDSEQRTQGKEDEEKITNDLYDRFSEKTFVKAVVKDYEQNIVVTGYEIKGAYTIDDNSNEYIDVEVWKEVIFYSEDDGFTTNSEYVKFNRESDGITEDVIDYVEVKEEAKFNSKNEITGYADEIYVNRDTAQEIEDIDLYGNARLRNYRTSDVVTIKGYHIYLNGTDDYIISIGQDDAVFTLLTMNWNTLELEKDTEITADRIEYYTQIDRAFARGNVKTELRGNMFTSNLLEYDGKKGEEGIITLRGNVRYVLADGVDGFADMIIYDIASGEITAESGDAEIDANPND